MIKVSYFTWSYVQVTMEAKHVGKSWVCTVAEIVDTIDRLLGMCSSFYCTAQHCTAPCGAVLCSTVDCACTHCPALYCTALHCPKWCSAVQYSRLCMYTLPCTVLCENMQCSAMQ